MTEKITTQFLLENNDFFKTAFAVHYPFSVDEIKKYKELLPWGGCTHSFYNSNFEYFFNASLGLAFNEGLSWNNEVIEIADFDCNHLAATDYDVEKFPLKKDVEIRKSIDAYLGAKFNHRSPTEKELEEFDPPNLNKIFSKKYSELDQSELDEIINDFRDERLYVKAILLNRSFYEVLFETILIHNKQFKVTSFFDLIDS